jgi:hypothetical protein
MTDHVQAWVFIPLSIFGFGAACFLFHLLRLSQVHGSRQKVAATSIKISGWFMGNGAAILGTFKYFDFDKSFSSPDATGIALLGYIMGFGLTIGVLSLKTHVPDRRQVVNIANDPELMLLVLILGLRKSIAAAAADLNLSVAEAETLLVQAMRRMWEPERRRPSKHKVGLANQTVSTDSPSTWRRPVRS